MKTLKWFWWVALLAIGFKTYNLLSAGPKGSNPSEMESFVGILFAFVLISAALIVFWVIGRAKAKFTAKKTNKKPVPPSCAITGLEFSADILLVMKSGEIIMTSESLSSNGKDYLDGAVFEVMVKMREGDPFFVYYKCDEYYWLAQQQVSIIDAQKGPKWRTSISEKIMVFLMEYIFYSSQENIGPMMVSYHHNGKHTNVVAYIEKLNEWYPIQQSDSDHEDTAEISVSAINEGTAVVSQFVAISNLSPTG